MCVSVCVCEKEREVCVCVGVEGKVCPMYRDTLVSRRQYISQPCRQPASSRTASSIDALGPESTWVSTRYKATRFMY